MSDTWIIVISGFKQDEDEHHGCRHLADRLETKYCDDKSIKILLRGWDANMASIAQRIVAESDTPCPKVVIFAYSWGVGRGARLLAHELDEIGLSVDYLVSADGVAHTTWFLSKCRAMVPSRMPRFIWYNRWECIKVRLRGLAFLFGYIPGVVPHIVLPSNVRRVIAFRQSRNLPMGHDITGERPAIIPVEYRHVNAIHAAMDDSEAWQQCCLEIAKTIVG